jgi:hippurate hydrolase
VERYFQQGQDEDDSSTALRDTIRTTITNDDDFHQFLTTTRRALHKHPQVMYQESFASETIQTILDELKISYTTGWARNTHTDVYPGKGGYGVVAHIGTGDKEQPCIILRADMDALPIKEATEGIDDFKSENEGQMHAW